MSGLLTLGGVALAGLLLPRLSSGASAAAPKAGPGQIVNRHGDVEDEGHLRPEDWARRWEKNQTGWHRKDVHPALASFAKTHLDSFARAEAVRNGSAPASSAPTVLVPLCGKSVDLRWLYEAGFRVIGVEIVTQAIIDFFYDESATFSAWRCEILAGTGGAPGRPALRRYLAGKDDRLQIVQADILSPQLSKDLLGLGEGLDAVWDRASLVAMNPPTRAAYAAAITNLAKKRMQQLVNIFHYDQKAMHGPPFSVSEAQLRALYPSEKGINIMLIDSQDFPLPQGPGVAPVPNKSNTFFVQHS